MKNTQENLDLIMENYNQSATDEYYKNIDGDWEITYYDEGTEVENINSITIDNNIIYVWTSVLEDGYDEGDSFYEMYKTLKEFKEDNCF